MKNRIFLLTTFFSMILAGFLTGDPTGEEDSWKSSVRETGETAIGRIVQIEGDVRILAQNELSSQPAGLHAVLFEKDFLITGLDGKVSVELLDGTMAVFLPKTEIQIRTVDNIFQKTGVAYYEVRSRDVADRTDRSRDMSERSERGQRRRTPMRIETSYAMLGVVGTEFVVDAREYNGEIILTEGELSIESPDGEPFEWRRRDPVDDFEKFAQSRMDSFSAYKREIYSEFIEYRQQISLKAGNRLTFNGKRVFEESVTEDLEAELQEMLQWLER